MTQVYWLIDGSYLYKSMKMYAQENKTKYNLDYKKLREKIEQEICKDNAKLTAYYFNSTPDPATDEQNAFHSWLKSASPSGPNIRVELYSLKEISLNCRKCGTKFTKSVQKGVDVGIVTTALKFQNKYEILVLSTGDGDLKIHYDTSKKTLIKRLFLFLSVMDYLPTFNNTPIRYYLSMILLK